MDQRIVCFVWREGTVESLVALQAAPRGGWNLPHGTRGPNEKLEEAARRIVDEALSVPVESLGIVDASHSETIYWAFSVVGAAQDELAGLHGPVEFKLPDDAIPLVPSLADRVTLRSQVKETSYLPRRLGLLERKLLELGGLKASYEQLMRNLSNAWADQRSIESANKRAGARPIVDELRRELRSVEALAVKDTTTAWSILKRAKRRQLTVMPKDQLRVQWAIIEAEANQKLAQWRMHAKVKLAMASAVEDPGADPAKPASSPAAPSAKPNPTAAPGPEAKPGAPMAGKATSPQHDSLPPVEAIVAVSELLDGYHDAFFDRAQLIRERLTSASLALVLMLLISETFLVTTLAEALGGEKTKDILANILHAAPFLGGMGAICSGLVSSLGSNAGKRPQAVLENTMQAARMVLGAGSGFAAVLLLARTLDNASLLAAAAFAAGTSERFIPSQVEKLLGDATPNGRQT